MATTAGTVLLPLVLLFALSSSGTGLEWASGKVLDPTTASSAAVGFFGSRRAGGIPQAQGTLGSPRSGVAVLGPASTAALPQSALAVSHEAKQPGDPWSYGRPTDRLGDGVGWQWPGQEKRGGRAGTFNPKAQGTGEFQPGGGTVTNHNQDGMVASTGKDNDSASGRNDGPGKPMYPGGPSHSTYTGPLTLQDLWSQQAPYVWMVLVAVFGVCLLVPCLVHATGEGQDGMGVPPMRGWANVCMMSTLLTVGVLALAFFVMQFGVWGMGLVCFLVGTIMVLGSLKTLTGEDDSKDEGMLLHQSLMMLGLLLILGTMIYFLHQFGLFQMVFSFHIMVWHNWWIYGFVFILIALGACCFVRSRTAADMTEDYREEWNAVRPQRDGPGYRSFSEAVNNIG